MYIFWPFRYGVVLYGVRWHNYDSVYVYVGDRVRVLFMVNYDNSCDILVLLGCHSSLFECFDVMANLRFGGRARQLPPHFDECASRVDTKIMSLLCGEL